ncbi:hypothetical protein [Roseibacillus persicicus]|uniref:Organic solvent tolerance-like N-terminal domain-containing protein n=1 Tax=Roseibacillus persicicus TaxID=454148 RepID=A0A918TEF4_9BACT|nr:hypothetical protein [Roseibacillus persicicus]GHC40844.1 hypothetical protein GCM10007100_01770 [Roseibacillus persicicus]
MKLRSLALLAISAASAADLSPTLEVLPLNSTLSDVTIPRFDENSNRVAYLKADLMEILADGPPVNDHQPIMVDCTGIKLRMETDQVGGSIAVDMERARYRMTPGVLTVQEKITATSPQFHLKGNGGVFHLDTQRGFLFGPVECLIFPEAKLEASTMNSAPFALLAATQLIAAEPIINPPTQEELLRIEKLALPTQPKVTADELKTSQSITEIEQESKAADGKFTDFAEKVESKSLNLLIQNPPQGNAAKAAKPPLPNPDLTINCDGGCFFDGNENLLVLLRNVIVKEERFTLTANKEIKVFFIVAPEEEAKEGEDKKDPSLNITDIKSLVATGGVNFSGVDKNGNPVEASAATAFYDDKLKTLILKDGKPTFWFKKEKLEVQLQAEDDTAFVRIEFSDDGLKASTSETGWKAGAIGLPNKR